MSSNKRHELKHITRIEYYPTKLLLRNLSEKIRECWSREMFRNVEKMRNVFEWVSEGNVGENMRT